MTSSSSSSPQVLSIQSSVTFGHVGNSAAVFPMQYRGVNVSSLHTLQYSSHVQYNCGFAGSKTSEQDVRGILSKLHTLSLSQEELAAQEGSSSSSSSSSLFSHILTGYIGSPEIVQAVADYIKQVKSSTTLKKKPFFFCDPVCGDNGRMYVLQTVAEGIRDQLVPLADAVAPNFFEASFLSGINIVDDATAMEAAKKIHEMGPRIVVITSYAPPSEEEDSANPTPDPRHKDDPNPRESHKTRLHCLLSRKMTMNGDTDDETSSATTKIVQDVFAFKNIIGHWVGTGDTFAALILSELAMRGDDMNALPQIVKNSINVMNSLVEETSRNQRVVGGQRELRIIENRKLFELDSAAAKNEQKLVEVAEHVVKSS